MDFRLTPEQTGFGQALTDLMRRADSVQVARAWAAGDTAPGLALWQRLAEQGVHDIVVPEDFDGMGGTLVDLCVAFEVLGHELAVGPWIESAAFAPALPSPLADVDPVPGRDEGRGKGRGKDITSVAVVDVAPCALDADVATAVLLLDGADVQLAEVAAARRSVDTTRHLFEVTGGRLLATLPAGAVDAALDQAALACAAELLGCGERLLADSVAYVKQRTQYGRVIGSYQAIKHQLADVRIALDFARPVVFGAALGDVPVAAAKLAAGDAAYLASRVGLQVHGAIGYTAEFDLGLWINRVRALLGAWGTPARHRARLAEQLGAR
jgi:alkylation response protein AidB-like acyl-CoA dehydrogenase